MKDTTIIILSALAITLFFMVFFGFSNQHIKECTTQHIVSIKQVSNGGFFSSDKCIYVLDNGKDILKPCYYEVGDTVCE